VSSRPAALIVDDNAINAELADAHLRRSGWTTRMVDSGTAALAAMEESAFDLVLLDISMPGMSGIEVCKTIRASAPELPTRIVAYTAHAMRDEHKVLYAAGFHDVLIKPVDRRAMLYAPTSRGTRAIAADADLRDGRAFYVRMTSYCS